MSSGPNSPGDLRVEGATVAFGKAFALRDVTLDVAAGERVAVVGPSGAGKSTLFRALTRSVALEGGKVLVGERDLYALSRGERREARRRIGTIHQAYNLVPQLPAGVNAALGEIGGMRSFGALGTFLFGPNEALAGRVEAALERVGLGDKARARTANLSGGQQQRVAVARLLVQRPALVLADEPFASVDPATTEKVLEALLDLNREGATLLVNLHDVELARRFPRIVALREGSVVFDGPPERLTGERLAAVYAGEEHRVVGPPEFQNGRGRNTEIVNAVRVAQGRDGVSAH